MPERAGARTAGAGASTLDGLSEEQKKRVAAEVERRVEEKLRKSRVDSAEETLSERELALCDYLVEKVSDEVMRRFESAARADRDGEEEEPEYSTSFFGSESPEHKAWREKHPNVKPRYQS